VTHQLRDNLVGTFLGGITLRDYPSDSPTSDETVYTTSAGLTWNINRYLDLTSTARLRTDVQKSRRRLAAMASRRRSQA
jgi:hypothetical protein